MTEPKAKPTKACSVDKFIGAAKAKPQMWGANIVGFGTYRFNHTDGRETERTNLLGENICAAVLVGLTALFGGVAIRRLARVG